MESSLEDYVELSVMLQYNNRVLMENNRKNEKNNRYNSQE